MFDISSPGSDSEKIGKYSDIFVSKSVGNPANRPWLEVKAEESSLCLFSVFSCWSQGHHFAMLAHIPYIKNVTKQRGVPGSVLGKTVTYIALHCTITLRENTTVQFH